MDEVFLLLFVHKKKSLCLPILATGSSAGRAVGAWGEEAFEFFEVFLGGEHGDDWGAAGGGGGDGDLVGGDFVGEAVAAALGSESSDFRFGSVRAPTVSASLS